MMNVVVKNQEPQNIKSNIVFHSKVGSKFPIIEVVMN